MIASAAALPLPARETPLRDLPAFELHWRCAVLRWRYRWPVWLVALYLGISRQDVRACLADWREWAHAENVR